MPKNTFLHRRIDKTGESADKPGSVVDSHSSGVHVAMYLERPTRELRGPRIAKRWFPYLVLLQAGFTLPPMLPSARCALTAPFHPCRHQLVLGRYVFCGTFRRLAPPRRYLAPCPVEPGLSSLPSRAQRLSGRLSLHIIAGFSPNRVDEMANHRVAAPSLTGGMHATYSGIGTVWLETTGVSATCANCK